MPRRCPVVIPNKLMNTGIMIPIARIAPKSSTPILQKPHIKFKRTLSKRGKFFMLTFQMSSLAVLRCSSINFHSSNLFRCLWATPQLSPCRSLIEGSEPRLFLLYCQFRLRITTAGFRRPRRQMRARPAPL